MPYYIYRVTPVGPIRQLAKISQFDGFKDASAEAKRLRRDVGLEPAETIKTIFAANELQAEELLNEPRGEEPMTGEDY